MIFRNEKQKKEIDDFFFNMEKKKCYLIYKKCGKNFKK